LFNSTTTGVSKGMKPGPNVQGTPKLVIRKKTVFKAISNLDKPVKEGWLTIN